MELVTPDPRQVEQILDDTYAHWHDGLSREAYGRWWTAQVRTAWGRERLCRYALVDAGVVVSSAKLYDLAAVLNGRPQRVAGIAAVFTPEPYRGRALARVLVERLLDRAAAEGFDLALLFSEIGGAYYEPFGFTAIPVVETSFSVFEHPRWGAPATLVRAGDERDVPAVVDMGRVRRARYRFALDRGLDFVSYAIAKRRLHAGLGPAGARELQFFVVEEGASAVAYVVLSVSGHAWTIEEWGDRDPTGARFGALLQTLVAREPSRERPAIRGWVPPDVGPPQLNVLATAPAAETMMIRGLAGATPSLGAGDVFYFHNDVF